MTKEQAHQILRSEFDNLGRLSGDKQIEIFEAVYERKPDPEELHGETIEWMIANAACAAARCPHRARLSLLRSVCASVRAGRVDRGEHF